MSKDTDRLNELIESNKDWIERELPTCAYGVAAAEKEGGKPRLALRPREITPDAEIKIEALRQRFAAEGFELDVRETGVVSAGACRPSNEKPDA